MSAPESWQLFLDFSRRTLLDEFWPRLRTCVESLTDEQLWWRPNDSSNSVGNLLLHLNGNVRQWLVVSFRGQADQRVRSAEFEAAGGRSALELLDALGQTLNDAGEVLQSLTEQDLLRDWQIQGFRATGMEAVYHVVEHFGMHYGQIAYITKMLRDVNLGFYRELDRTGRASAKRSLR